MRVTDCVSVLVQMCPCRSLRRLDIPGVPKSYVLWQGGVGASREKDWATGSFLPPSILSYTLVQLWSRISYLLKTFSSSVQGEAEEREGETGELLARQHP